MTDSPGVFTNNTWEAGAGAALISTNPATSEVMWQGRSARSAQVKSAVASASRAASTWANMPSADRLAICRQFAERLQQIHAEVADRISRETGKPRWEAKTEVDAMIAKVAISADAFADRCRETQADLAGVRSATRFRPHGVVAVLGPFNFPGHLPNGHIVPALLAGNTVVFKPSELTPAVGEMMAAVWESAGIPPGVFNLVQGGLATGEALAGHPRLDGLFFTGSAATGLALSRQFADTPGKILALEMGGNNPLIAWNVADFAAAAICIIQSAFITAGQRCSCARRLIIPTGQYGEAIIAALVEKLKAITVGLPNDSPEPFMGPVISSAVATKLIAAQEVLLTQHHATAIVPMRRLGRSEALLSPGIIEMPARNDSDDEIFGPLLQVIRVENFAEAMEEANRTQFGLCAGLISDSQSNWDLFSQTIRAGVIYWNRPTTGASSRLPFGGLGASGNHRPSAYLAADYCSHAIAVAESDRVTMPAKLPPGLGH